MKSRADSLIRSAVMAMGMAALSFSASAQAAQGAATAAGGPPGMPEKPSSTVYMTRDISPAGMMSMYKALGVNLPGKVAVKLSTGEDGSISLPRRGADGYPWNCLLSLRQGRRSSAFLF
jgi:hypothetical protein